MQLAIAGLVIVCEMIIFDGGKADTITIAPSPNIFQQIESQPWNQSPGGLFELSAVLVLLALAAMCFRAARKSS